MRKRKCNAVTRNTSTADTLNTPRVRRLFFAQVFFCWLVRFFVIRWTSVATCFFRRLRPVCRSFYGHVLLPLNLGTVAPLEFTRCGHGERVRLFLRVDISTARFSCVSLCTRSFTGKCIFAKSGVPFSFVFETSTVKEGAEINMNIINFGALLINKCSPSQTTFSKKKTQHMLHTSH